MKPGGGTDRAAPRVSREALLAMTPEVIRETLPMAPWDIGRLHGLDLPVQLVAVADLAWLLDLPLWQLNGARFSVSPGQVRADPAQFPDHLRRVLAASFEHPIHLVEHQGRMVVLDGYHRLLKAAIQGRTQIDAMILSQQDLESICGTEAPGAPPGTPPVS